jgi:hypothetical protein|tara:strand:+ start:259 stop:600 length:342 start_codon:yes stop_codon:yes gene_type:complete
MSKKPTWLKRALDKKTPTLNKQTVRTAVEWHSDGKRKILFPTIRQTGLKGPLRKYNVEDARKIAERKGDFMEVKSFKKGNEISKMISNMIDKKRYNKKKHGGSLLVAKIYKGF